MIHRSLILLALYFVSQCGASLNIKGIDLSSASIESGLGRVVPADVARNAAKHGDVKLLGAPQVSYIDVAQDVVEDYDVELLQATPVPVPGPAPECYGENDGNLEIEYPPRLDRDNTGVIFNGTGTAFFEITVRVPVQYREVNISFIDATDASAAYISIDDPTSVYWTETFNPYVDPCNYYYSAIIPWDLFRESLGGVTSQAFATEKVFRSTILTVAEKPLIMAGREYMRTVTARIPFKVTFQLQVPLVKTINVPSNWLGVEAALLASSILTVSPDAAPFGTAELILVTSVNLPLMLGSANITVDEPDLESNLAINEIVDQRDCPSNGTYCVQFWRIYVEPHKCTLDGNFTSVVLGTCHGTPCVHPDPDFTEIIMTVVSDNMCGLVQQVTIEGELLIDPTACNGRLEATVNVWNPEGATIVDTEVIEVIASPLVGGSGQIVVHDDSTAILDYQEAMPQGDQATFSFIWDGSVLLCDRNVDGVVEVLVQVEFEATQEQILLGAPEGRQKKLLSFGVSKQAANAKRRHPALLSSADSTREIAEIAIEADPNTVDEGTATESSEEEGEEGTGGEKSGSGGKDEGPGGAEGTSGASVLRSSSALLILAGASTSLLVGH